jgi:hypothetical protein
LQDGALIRARFAREENPEVERIAREEVERTRRAGLEAPPWARAVVRGAKERKERMERHEAYIDMIKKRK